MGYTKNEIRLALHVLDQTGSPKKVLDTLGYPSSKASLYNWIEEREKYISPEEDIPIEKRFSPRIQNVCQEDIKYCLMRGMSVKSTAETLNYSHAAVYKWRRIFQQEGNKEVMNSKYKRSTPSQKEYEDMKAQMREMQLQIDILKETINVLKKDHGIDLIPLKNSEKAMIVDAMRNNYSLPLLLKELKLSRSSYYYQKQIEQTSDKYKDVRFRIVTLFRENHSRYGYRRIHCLLRKEGIILSEKVVRRIMKEEHLHVLSKKKRKYNSYQGEITEAVTNVINRDFHAKVPNQKWLTDITEFSIPAGKVYLSPIIDCYDGLPVVWTIGTSPNAEMVNSMLDMGIALLKESEKPIVHSDRGNHYRWPGWIERMDKAKLTRSMSQKGCSPDNSACEGFFGHLKNEMFYGRNWNNVSLESFIQSVNEYICWYRKDRIKMSLGGLSPLEYRRRKGYAM